MHLWREGQYHSVCLEGQFEAMSMYVPSDLVIQILECHPADKLQQLTFKGLQMYSWLLCMRQGGKNLNFQGLENSLNKSWPIGLAGKETHRPNERARSGREFHATGAGGG